MHILADYAKTTPVGSTFSSIQIHVVFSTKDRRPSLSADVRQRLYPYINGVLTEQRVIPLAIGGVEDHLHLLLGIKPTHLLANVVRDVKRASSLWLNEGKVRDFHWQDGYAAFSIGASGMAALKGYVANQEEHHRKVSYLDELRALLDEACVPYDERFLV